MKLGYPDIHLPSIFSFLGCLSSSIHGTKNIGTELAINLDLFANAYYASIHHCLSSEILPVIEYLKTGKTCFNKQRASSESISKQDLKSLHQLVSKECTIKSMKSSEYNPSPL